MADFQISRGIVANLPTELSDGHIWFASDEGKFYIDCPDENGVLQRIALNAKNADMVLGTTPATSVNESDTEFPTSKAAMDYFASKHDPVFTGSFSIGRKEGTTVGEYSFAVGDDVEASGPYAVALGYQTQATGPDAVAMGYQTLASGEDSEAQGSLTQANATWAHAEGANTVANGEVSHVEGVYSTTTSAATGAHAEGYNTLAASAWQHVEGKNNIEDANGVYAKIVGNGTDTTRSNAFTLDWSGNGWFSGAVTIGEDAKALATEDYAEGLVEWGYF